MNKLSRELLPRWGAQETRLGIVFVSDATRRHLGAQRTFTQDDMPMRLAFWRSHKKQAKALWQQANDGSVSAIIDNNNW